LASIGTNAPSLTIITGELLKNELLVEILTALASTSL